MKTILVITAILAITFSSPFDNFMRLRHQIGKIIQDKENKIENEIMKQINSPTIDDKISGFVEEFRIENDGDQIKVKVDRKPVQTFGLIQEEPVDDVVKSMINMGVEEKTKTFFDDQFDQMFRMMRRESMRPRLVRNRNSHYGKRIMPGSHKQFSGRDQVKIDEKDLYSLLIEQYPFLDGGKIVCIEQNQVRKALFVTIDFEDKNKNFFRIDTRYSPKKSKLNILKMIQKENPFLEKPVQKPLILGSEGEKQMIEEVDRSKLILGSEQEIFNEVPIDRSTLLLGSSEQKQKLPVPVTKIHDQSIVQELKKEDEKNAKDLELKDKL